MNTINNSSQIRMPMLTWIVLPLIGIWLIFGYFIGLANDPVWFNEVNNNSTVVASENQEEIGFTANEQSYIPSYEWDGKGLVTIYFDDAWYSQYEVGFPLLEKNNYKAALAVPTNYIGFESYMSWAQIKRLQYSGWEIVSHSRSHNCDANDLTEGNLAYELLGAKSDLSNRGLNYDNYVAPCGVVTEEMTNLAKTHYLSLRSSDRGLNPLPINDPYTLKAYVLNNNDNIESVRQWLKEAELSNSWLIIAFHQLDDSNQEYSVTKDFYEQVIEEVKLSNLQVVLPTQALQAYLGE